ncbi:hypothetical protein [Streptomyces sp. AK02-01A]|uniref:hypothetical protein n=1 Tax=Streptomyces sp. AK02-01A TaxID=3028648 RepID=UPI0029A9D3E2|nr:hypothetical protein [Streptomyces sp. AK02-01A]MDX3851782.1 hypothetical protein [Streptomyces sp. AK02-01A]
MIRNIIGSVLALVGAAAAVLSSFYAWFGGRQGRDYRVGDLFTGISGDGAALFGSLLLPFAVAALVTLAGLVLRSRPLVTLAGLIVLGFSVLWTVRQGQAAGGLTVDGSGNGLGVGVAGAFGGGILLLLAALVMSGRHHRRRTRDTMPMAPAPAEPSGQDQEDRGPYEPSPYGSDPHGSGDYDSSRHGSGHYEEPRHEEPRYESRRPGSQRYGSPDDRSAESAGYPEEDDTRSWGAGGPWDNGSPPPDEPPRH